MHGAAEVLEGDDHVLGKRRHLLANLRKRVLILAKADHHVSVPYGVHLKDTMRQSCVSAHVRVMRQCVHVHMPFCPSSGKHHKTLRARFA